MERTLVIIKPDGVQRGLIGPLVTRLERRGLRIVALKMMHIGEALARQHYAVHEGKPFYEPLVEYISSGPVVLMVIEGDGVVHMVRQTVGATDPAKAAPGTIRGDFGLSIGRNLIHASDAPETGKQEVALFFEDDELLSYQRDNDRWIFEQ
ncbi:MAG: nucleoside-diphosphate kinase [Chloroflexia bacterium]|nr:nucleoside-diphosphate kinase [Chloroflexia bacterium]